MATPLGHSIVGYTIARLAGVNSPPAVAIAIGAANLPDVDLLMGYMANGDMFSLHHEVITHRRSFPLLVGAAVGAAAAGWALLRGRRPGPGNVLRPAALATALVGSHVVMDPLPLPYDDMAPRTGSFWDVAAGNAWNAVIDMAIYGTLALAVLERKGALRTADA
jgi:hypothetical protein